MENSSDLSSIRYHYLARMEKNHPVRIYSLRLQKIQFPANMDFITSVGQFPNQNLHMQ